jgi:hypothetical protein
LCSDTEAVEPCLLQALHKEDYEMIMSDPGHDLAFCNTMAEILFKRQLHYMNEFLSFIRDTPQQRYLNLVKKKSVPPATHTATLYSFLPW